MGTWKNQYIGLVETKPEFIVAENDRETPEASKQKIEEQKANFSGIFVEIGSGSGMHLLRLAAQNPDTLCIGLEIRFKRAFKTGEKAEKQGLKNVLVLRTDANFLGHLFEAGELAGIFVNYPDPWDKRRWRKNRILNEGMLTEMHQLLAKDGFLRYKTDHREYFQSTATLLREQKLWNMTKYTEDLVTSEWMENNIATEFEGLFRSQNKPLHLLEVIPM